MSAEQKKAAARRAAFAARKTAHGAGLGPALTEALLQAIGPVRNKVIAGYMPIRTEADPIPAMTTLVAQNRICVPVIQAAGHPLRFREWRPDAAMIDGPFGAQVPASGAWLAPDIVIVPLVAFDQHLNRLGYGGGFYDRTLEGLRNAGDVHAIGFAYAAQELHELPLEPTDQALNLIVTEAGTLAADAATP